MAERLNRRSSRADSLDVESLRVKGMDQAKGPIPQLFVLKLAFQSIGVVFGDLGTSPLYVYSSVFTSSINDDDDILGVLSLIIYTIIAVPLIKYIFIVLHANDNGEGGTFALYSLICRHAKIGLVHNQHPTDLKVSSYTLETPTRKAKLSNRVKEALENRKVLQNILLLIVLLGPCLVIGDGALTPAISVLSAIQGIGVQVEGLSPNVEVIITIIVLFFLFNFQRFGTHKVAFIFGPVMLVWFLSIGIIGLYNIVRWDPSVFRAFNPAYAVTYFTRNSMGAWMSLGGVVLCITGAEAMFADLGHFTVKSMQIAFTCLVFPSLMCAYIGQAAFLMKNQSVEDIGFTFYRSIPEPVYWPMFVVATCAAIIASQAMISATFSMIRNAMTLGCFPRVTIKHTSLKVQGQIYIPEINWLTMWLSIAIVGGFRSTELMGHAYGIAVVGVFFISTCLLTLIMVMIWQTNIILSIIFFVVFVTIDGTYFSSVLSKVVSGGWVPLLIASCFLTMMYSWHFGTRMKHLYEASHKLSKDWVLSLGTNRGVARVPGVGLVYTELPQGVPAILGHIITNLPAIHSILVFVCIRHLAVSTVPDDERILIRRFGPRSYRMFRCAVRYGYTEHVNRPVADGHNLESLLLSSLQRFIRTEGMEASSILSPKETIAPDGSSAVPEDDFKHDGSSAVLEDDFKHDGSLAVSIDYSKQDGSSIVSIDYSKHDGSSVMSVDDTKSLEEEAKKSEGGLKAERESMVDELLFLQKAREAGVVYVLGDSDVSAKKESSFFKKIVIDYIYAFLRRNCRPNSLYLSIPKARLLKVGMEYNV